MPRAPEASGRTRAAGPHGGGEPLTAGFDLASRWLGASVIAASDESFGDKENLLDPRPAAFEPGRYGNRGEIVDGWETRRRREPGNDWAIIRLGAPGIVTSVDVDTSFFTGNFPESCSVEAIGLAGYPSPAELADRSAEWTEIVPRSPLRGDAHNTFPVADSLRFTHVRLSIFPDGGVARLRVMGHLLPDPRDLDGVTVDLISQEYGSAVVQSSDGFYTSATSLNRPDTARSMGEGWETRRRRDKGHDFVVFQLAIAGCPRRAVIDTAHFKYNASAEVALYGSAEHPAPSAESAAWNQLLPPTRLQPDTRHVFPLPAGTPAIAALKLDAFPDGGLSRVRLIGPIDPDARRQAGYRWFNALPERQAAQSLAEAGVPPHLVAKILALRPVNDAWRDSIREPITSPGLGGFAEQLEGVRT
jgi:allantoicase